MKAKSQIAQTYQRLQADLLDSRYPPGCKLKIDQLCRDLGVSPGAVREALSRLTSDGLVRAEPQRGFIVAPVSAADLVDLTSVRIDIETRCVRRAIEIGDVAWEGRVLSALHQLLRLSEHMSAPKAGRPVLNPNWTRLHGEFHDTLVSACDSRWWLRLREQLYLQAERYRRLLIPHARSGRDAATEHKAIAAAVLARDAPLACDLLARHFQLTTDTLLALKAPFKEQKTPSAYEDEG